MNSYQFCFVWDGTFSFEILFVALIVTLLATESLECEHDSQLTGIFVFLSQRKYLQLSHKALYNNKVIYFTPQKRADITRGKKRIYFTAIWWTPDMFIRIGKTYIFIMLNMLNHRKYCERKLSIILRYLKKKNNCCTYIEKK